MRSGRPNARLGTCPLRRCGRCRWEGRGGSIRRGRRLRRRRGVSGKFFFKKAGKCGWDRAGHYFFNLVFVSLVCTGAVVGEGFGAGEFVVGGRGGDYVAVTGYLAGEAGDGTGYWVDFLSIEGGNEGREGGTLVDFAEDDDAGEFGAGVAGDDGVVEEYAWDCYSTDV